MFSSSLLSTDYHYLLCYENSIGKCLNYQLYTAVFPDRRIKVVSREWTLMVFGKTTIQQILETAARLSQMISPNSKDTLIVVFQQNLKLKQRDTMVVK